MITPGWRTDLRALVLASASACGTSTFSLFAAAGLTADYQCVTALADAAAAATCGLLAGGLVLGKLLRDRPAAWMLLGSLAVALILGILVYAHVFRGAVPISARAAFAFVPALALPTGAGLGHRLRLANRQPLADIQSLAEAIRMVAGSAALCAGCLLLTTGLFAYHVIHWIWPIAAGAALVVAGCLALRVSRIRVAAQ